MVLNIAHVITCSLINMYHAKKFSTVGLVPHKPQSAEQLANVGVLGGATVNNTTTSGGSGKQRLRWTSELHDRFVDAITQLGGPDSGYLLFSVDRLLVLISCFLFFLCAFLTRGSCRNILFLTEP